ncbi:MAG: hypothetical protein CO158_07200 [Piscirickettsiaceae bacterium CG_4_9_14_3_um_filter_43_564]|nr:hypothetical protein [Thiomicrospira sp.]OIP94900.1 MAG: hypothetical protein AUK56_07620 [Thiomicrospira sp. CG2_30_44_34]PIQ05899.1 MAG: hypothetical protein COW74_01675 [Piscirickettsiaceae bacterium CG18_big_fil_WC_8_21_14_2_50_44_103]PIU37668.1 MAG: hypothetical protein COT01_10330 [Piscirickettsiaceae bacterium CG07_land_8_20_14_0_80_44_28]PIW57263.1 MAG: hypothetical protein COW14_06825 [Piscirickettsiaceae bacterium CG12_big_fil_rev_8_21_14_0_65_44_934]PIX78362.1 MAG: hypothetical p
MEQPRFYRHGHGSDEEHKKDQALFSQLLAQHHEIVRETVFIKNGIKAKTTTQNPDLVSILQAHVQGMEKRFENGRAIRSWDPLFAALFEYRDEIHMKYYPIQNGIEAILTSDNPAIIEIIHCHDKTLHSFIEEGSKAGKRQSPKPDWLE